MRKIFTLWIWMKINFKMRIDIFVEGVRLFSVFHATQIHSSSSGYKFSRPDMLCLTKAGVLDIMLILLLLMDMSWLSPSPDLSLPFQNNTFSDVVSHFSTRRCCCTTLHLYIFANDTCEWTMHKLNLFYLRIFFKCKWYGPQQT